MSNRRFQVLQSRGWWYRATDEQRLAQVDAAIELGLTASIVALNCGGGSGRFGEKRFGENVTAFANIRGRYFGRAKTNSGIKRQARMASLRLARRRGTNVTVDAFDIFGVRQVVDDPFLDGGAA